MHWGQNSFWFLVTGRLQNRYPLGTVPREGGNYLYLLPTSEIRYTCYNRHAGRGGRLNPAVTSLAHNQSENIKMTPKQTKKQTKFPPYFARIIRFIISILFVYRPTNSGGGGMIIWTIPPGQKVVDISPPSPGFTPVFKTQHGRIPIDPAILAAIVHCLKK